MDDLISRQAVLALPRDRIRNMKGEIVEEMIDVADIKALPSAQPERKKGEWVLSGENEYTCSVCGKTIITNKDYIKEHKWCFGCGADMRGEQDG